MINSANLAILGSSYVVDNLVATNEMLNKRALDPFDGVRFLICDKTSIYHIPDLYRSARYLQSVLQWGHNKELWPSRCFSIDSTTRLLLLCSRKELSPNELIV